MRRHPPPSWRRRLVKGALVAIATVPGAAWISAGAMESLPTDGWVLTPAKEAALGERALTEFLSTRRLSQDGSLLLRVDRIGRRIAAASDRSDASYRFIVIEGRMLQAYSFPGGTVCVTDSAVKRFADDDMLAFAVSHEMAHLSLRHHAIALRVAQVTDAVPDSGAEILAQIQSSFDQASEAEADRYGALYAVRAGFAYSAGPAALEILAQSGSPSHDDSHADFTARIDGLKRFRLELERSVSAFRGGVEAMELGRYEDAIDGLTIFVAQFPQSFAGRLDLGAAYLGRVRKRSGTPSGLAEVLPILPEPDIVLRGDLDRVDVEQAGSEFTAALGIGTDHPWAHAGLALVELRRSHLDEARRQIDLARQSMPKSPELLLCAGNVEYVAGSVDAALALYEQALAQRHDWPAAIKNIALVHERRGDAAAARDGWSKLASDPIYGTEARTRMQTLPAPEASSSPQ